MLDKRVSVIGGAGYTGWVLVRHLLRSGFRVRIIDACWFGAPSQGFSEFDELDFVNTDFRNFDNYVFENGETVVHLANVANDPAVELDQSLSWEVNVLGTDQLCRKAVKEGVGHLIFASSGSVYGIRQEERVTEALEPIPISTYNKTKMVAERVLFSFSGELPVSIVRPATVCGVSSRERTRFDVAVNALTISALKNRSVSIHGGSQCRPNIHVDDLARIYHHLIDGSIPIGLYNAGFENMSLLELGEAVREIVGPDVTLKVEATVDQRSYRLDSSKLLGLGFIPQKFVRDAIRELCDAFASDPSIETPASYTVAWMKANQLG